MYRPAIAAVYIPAYRERVGIAFTLFHPLLSSPNIKILFQKNRLEVPGPLL
ncbi:MAG: hypothetical protein MJE68_16320 [Proteobacteria bacterium]|nr:hypothetical protein [Pseudomonadota bacterium]